MGYNKKVLGDLLQKILAHTTKDPVSMKEHGRLRTLCGAGTTISMGGGDSALVAEVAESAGPTLSILTDGCNAWEEFIDEAIKDPSVALSIGRKAIDDQIGNCVKKLFGQQLSQLDWAQLVRSEILQPLKSEVILRTCFVPIINIDIAEEFRLGQTSLVTRDHASLFVEKYLQEHRYGGATDEAKAHQKLLAENIFRDALQESASFARVDIEVHAKHAYELSLSLAKRELSVLRAFTYLLQPFSLRSYCYLPMEASAGIAICPSFESAPGHHSFTIPHQRYGHLGKFSLNKLTIAHLNENCGFQVLCDILKKPHEVQNSFEAAVIRSFDRVGRAVLATTNDDEFAGYAIALERLLVKDGDESTTEKIAERLALWVGGTTESRTSLYSRMKKLYGIRSKIVHAAYVGVTDQECQELYRAVITGLIRALLRSGDFDSHDKYTDHLNKLKFGPT